MSIESKTIEIINSYKKIVGCTTISVEEYLAIRKQAYEEIRVIDTVQPIAEQREVVSYIPPVTQPTSQEVKPTETIEKKVAFTANVAQMPKTNNVANIMRKFDN